MRVRVRCLWSPFVLLPSRNHARIPSEIFRSQNRTQNAKFSVLTAVRYLYWDDKEWNSVKDWIRVAERAVRKSHPRHGDVELPATLKVAPKR